MYKWLQFGHQHSRYYLILKEIYSFNGDLGLFLDEGFLLFLFGFKSLRISVFGLDFWVFSVIRIVRIVVIRIGHCKDRYLIKNSSK
jgi:hypothetical protein